MLSVLQYHKIVDVYLFETSFYQSYQELQQLSIL